MTIIQFLSAFGFGAIVTALVQAWLSYKSYTAKRNFQEKKEAYLGYLDAMHKSEINGDEKSALNVGHWQNRIELVGSKSVVKACYYIKETNPLNDAVHPARSQALKELKDAMRKDLKVDF